MNKITAMQEPSAVSKAKSAETRQYVNFQFLKLDPKFLTLLSNEKVVAKQEFLSAIETHHSQMILLTYALTGIRADCDLLFWRISADLEIFQEMSFRLRTAGLGRYLQPTYSYLSTTRRSLYVDKINPEHDDARLRIVPGKSKYLFVYPFVKTREWYQLPLAERQKMMDDHIQTGARYPSVKINTTYSFGLDDQEFVLAFESDSPHDFLDLVMELRETKASSYTLRDTPTFTCILRDIHDIVDRM